MADGAVLQASGCHVLVRGDRDRRRVELSVWGPVGQRRSALNVVLDRLEAVHRLNPEAKPRLEVPLPEAPDRSVEYEHLLTLEARYGPDHRFDPVGAARQYAVRELLDGVRLDRRGEDWVGERMKTLMHSEQPSEPVPSSHSRPLDLDPPAPRRGRMALAAGAFAATAAAAMLALPDDWRVRVGVVVGAGTLVALLFSYFDPGTFFRRLLNGVIGVGLLGAVAGVAAKAISKELGFTFEIDSTVSTAFWIAWPVVVLGLIGASLAEMGILPRSKAGR